MAALKSPEVRKRVKITAKGGFRRIGFLVEASGFQMRKRGKVWTGEELVSVEGSTLELRGVVKGGPNASYEIDVVCNGKGKKISGNIPNGSNKADISSSWNLADFGM